MQFIGSEPHIPHPLFLKAIKQSHNATSTKTLFLEDNDLIKYKSTLIYHLPVVGSHDAELMGRYWSDGISGQALTYFDSQKNLTDPVRAYIMNGGRPIWISDLNDGSHHLDEEMVKRVKLALYGIGDGICIPLFGPFQKSAYAFISFHKPKEFYDQIFTWQMHSLLQAMHVKYCIIRESLNTKIKLTPRESDVLELITFGKTNPEIGKILGISANTVTGYVKQIFLKLNVSDRVSAALKARNYHVSHQ